MMNLLKLLLFRAYLGYYRWCPLQRGKYRLGCVLNYLFGRAQVHRFGVTFKAGCVSMLDQKIIAGEAQDPIVLQAMREALHPQEGFLDIGANVGYFSIVAAVAHRAQVWAFEPSPRELASLYENLAANACSTVTVFPFALGANTMNARLNIAGVHNPGMNSFCNLRDLSNYEGSVTVQVGRLGEFMTGNQLENIRLCKIDVEGYEMEVLEGMEESMKCLARAIFVVEISPAYLARQSRIASDVYAYFERHHFYPRGQIRESAQWDEVFAQAIPTKA